MTITTEKMVELFSPTPVTTINSGYLVGIVNVLFIGENTVHISTSEHSNSIRFIIRNEMYFYSVIVPLINSLNDGEERI